MPKLCISVVANISLDAALRCRPEMVGNLGVNPPPVVLRLVAALLRCQLDSGKHADGEPVGAHQQSIGVKVDLHAVLGKASQFAPLAL